MNTYSPYEHAQALAVTVYFRPLARWHAVWFATQRTLVLRQNMGVAEERAVLACALFHVESGTTEPVVPSSIPADVAARLTGATLSRARVNPSPRVDRPLKQIERSWRPVPLLARAVGVAVLFSSSVATVLAQSDLAQLAA